jgi:CheY-specific phosphatase CheX
MREQMNQILSEVAVDTMEKLAFMFAFGEEAADIAAVEPAVCAAVAFNGPFGGILTIQINTADLAEMAGNMLGMDSGDSLSVENQQDALKEALNVLCGNILPAIAGKEAVFDIDSPQIMANGQSPQMSNGTELLAETAFNLEAGTCRLALFIDMPIPDGALQLAGER